MGGLHNKEIRACVLWFKGVHVRNHLFLGQFQCGSGLLLCEKSPLPRAASVWQWVIIM